MHTKRAQCVRITRNREASSSILLANHAGHATINDVMGGEMTQPHECRR